LIFLYTLDDYLLISFDKNEKLRFNWYNLLVQLCKSLYQSLKIYQVNLKIKYFDLPSSDNQKKTYTNSRVCFNEENNDFLYLILLDFKKAFYEKLDKNIEVTDLNLIKIHIPHIKRIGHDKSNRFFIELGKRSVYGQLSFIFKCLNYDLACYLHRKTFQFIDKYKYTQSNDVPRRCNMNESNINTRSNTFSSFLNETTSKISTLQMTNSDKSTGSTIKRYYTLFSRNSLKLKTHVSDVFKRLSWNKLTSSSERLSSSKISDENSIISSSKSFNTSSKVSSSSVFERSDVVTPKKSSSVDDYVEYISDRENKKSILTSVDDRFQVRCNTEGTEGCIFVKSLQKDGFLKSDKSFLLNKGI
jgi:hypothetical protein